MTLDDVLLKMRRLALLTCGSLTVMVFVWYCVDDDHCKGDVPASVNMNMIISSQVCFNSSVKLLHYLLQMVDYQMLKEDNAVLHRELDGMKT